MRRIITFIRITLVGGILLLIPLTAMIIVTLKALMILKRIITPITDKMELDKVAGVGAETFVSILLLVIICFIAGMFMRTQRARQFKQWMENKVLVYIPGYSYLQALSNDKLAAQGSDWKPATIYVDDNEVICFITGESEHYYSLFLPSAPSPSTGSVRVRDKNSVTHLPITVSETVMIIRQFGKGGAKVLELVRKQHTVT
ncbi:MAG: hypothetical protein J7497_01415 [Chitinophagaceae bacterium]|nr:hypothetical protein [Chitinophagaceae bacterium]